MRANVRARATLTLGLGMERGLARLIVVELSSCVRCKSEHAEKLAANARVVSIPLKEAWAQLEVSPPPACHLANQVWHEA